MTAALPRPVLAPEPAAAEAANEPAAPARTAARGVAGTAAPAGLSPGALRRRRLEVAKRILAPLLGLLLFVGLWSLVAKGGSIPGPQATFEAAKEVFADLSIATARTTRASAGRS